jgi:thiol-disulfide isomerase/thioredoxin
MASPAPKRTPDVTVRRRFSASTFTWAVVGLVVAGVVLIIVVRLTSLESSNGSLGAVSGPAPATIIREVSGVSAHVINTIGVSSGLTPVSPLVTLSGQHELTTGGRPEVLYVGAEFCPYCAAERWPLAVALARFGTFAHLGLTESAPSPEYFPLTPTLTFFHSTYASKYLSFVAVETETRTHGSLQPLTSAERTLIGTFDSPAFVPGLSQTGSIPFVDVGNRFLRAGSSYIPGILAHLAPSDVARGFADATSPVTRAIVASANYYTAGICLLTHQQPASVCSSPGVSAADRKLGLTSTSG